MGIKLDRSAVGDLVSRIDAKLVRDKGRLIGFIASGRREGNTLMAKSYASALSTQLRRRVLLLSADGRGASGYGLLHALAANHPLQNILRRRLDGVNVASLGGSEPDETLWDLIAREDLWKDLRGRFDDIVLDLPSVAVSRLGLLIASHCDGVVVVLEADKTRAPVAASLVGALRGVRAHILGTVLNKRRFYLPERIYRWL